MNSLRWRQIVVGAVTLFGLYLIAPTVIYFMQPLEVRMNPELVEQKIPSFFPRKTVKLGLDIQGGVQLVLGVDTAKAVENRLSRIGTELTRWAKENNYKVKSAYVVKDQQRLRVELEPDQDPNAFREAFKLEFPGLEQRSREDRVIDYLYDEAQIKTIKQSASKQATMVVRGRVDKWGVAEPMIAERADGSIMVQLPGFKDPARARELLGRTAQLKFKIVDDKFDGFAGLTANLPEGVKVDSSFGTPQFVTEDRDAVIKLTEGKIPEDRELLFERKELAGGKKAEYTSYLVFAATEISGEDVLDAGVTQDSDSFDNRPAVSLKFTGAGGKRFAEVTGEHVKERMAIVLDDEVVSAPSIQQKISGGTARITLGNENYEKTVQEANQLSLILKSGALPARITIEEERQVGATLGPELAKEGVIAAMVGLGLVLSFMAIYYGLPGMIANTALIMNGVLMLAAMTMFGFSLSLPGIAGFILTLGMAIDANVLINERIRQELAAGKTAKKATELGFDRVFWTIIDSNVTTLIAAMVLLETSSSGPIRGFAITLILGLTISMFTAMYCTRTFFMMALGGNKTEQQLKKWVTSGFRMERNFKFDFMGRGLMGTAICAVIAVAGLGLAASRGINWAVDFAGGTEMEMEFGQTVSVDRIRSAAEEAGAKDLTIQRAGDEKSNRYIMRFERMVESAAAQPAEGTPLTTEEQEKVQLFSSAMSSKLTDFQPQVLRVDSVGPQIGKELQRQGAASLFYALVGIVIYILLRFDMRFGPGAIAKMLVDVSIVVGFYSLGWISFDLTSIAALLTVIGYSINDVIVIFDRVRENFVMNPRRSVSENVNISINETLTRAINTSISTFVSLLGILFLGSGSIWNFAAAMTVGVVAATMSSMYIACPFIVWTEQFKRGQLGKAKAA
jgi:protein-export membrane protein SecD/preprotein translocase SecF subunit